MHTDAWYAKKVRELVDTLKPCAIWLKDAMGLLTPERTRTLVPVFLKNSRGVPVEFHSHCNTGLAQLCLLEAVRLGIKTVHTCVPPLANGTSLPSTLNTIRNLRELGYNPIVDEKAVEAESAHFMYVAKREGKPVGAPVEYDVFQATHGMAGGTISNLKWMIEQRGMLNRWQEVVEEITRLGKEWGYPPNITPYSQIMNVQAVLNITMNERYAIVPDETIRYLLGHFGQPPAPIDQNVIDKVSALPNAKPFLNWVQPQPSLEDLRKEFGRPGMSDEELALRVTFLKEHVDATIAAGPIKNSYPRGDKPVMALIKELVTRRDISYLQVKKRQ